MQQFVPKQTNFDRNFTQTFTAKAPSNIALVKYWGKNQNQTPANPSLSFTLSKALTHTTVKVSPKQFHSNTFELSFFFDGKEKPSFLPKIEQFFSKITEYLPFLPYFHFEIHSSNTFPHSSGIASSASAMAALSLCLMQMEESLYGEAYTQDFFLQKASFLARIGSGSACRSLYGGLVEWGEHGHIPNSSDYYAIAYPFEVHKVFEQYTDTILLIDKGQKQVSSSQGHGLMHLHPYAAKRFEQANHHITKLQGILQEGNTAEFVALVESEALTLHAMMMTSSPYFLLMKPNTLSAIERIWQFRTDTRLDVGFTLDAGANVHLLYPSAIASKVQPFIDQDLKPLCENGAYLTDCVQ